VPLLLSIVVDLQAWLRGERSAPVARPAAKPAAAAADPGSSAATAPVK